MSSTYTQDTRVCRLSTSLPPDTLTLVEFSGVEHINEVAVYTVRAVATRLVELGELLGKPMQINIVHANQSERIVHLMCFSARSLGQTGDGHLYEFELRPWFWMMTYRVNSRIFHDQTVIDILMKVFQDNGGVSGTSFTDRTNGLNRRLEYVVQYRESDWAFCRRLMEEVGINFHVEMENDKHRLVMTSDGISFNPVECGAVKYTPTDSAFITDNVPLDSWHPQHQVASFGVRMVDYNYLTPTVQMEVKDQLTTHLSAVPRHEVYDHPGRYENTSDGNDLARRRLAGLRSHDKLVKVEARHSYFGAGMVFNLAEHEVDPSQRGKYVVLSAMTHFSGQAYRSGGSGGSFHSSYVVTKEGNPVAPLQITPRPRIVGPQTALVTTGAETGDEHGRVKVRFHWEQNDCSMLVRVAQIWASKKWGAVFIPHAGMEVVVEFLDGDPDRPLVTGCVYNADNVMPWDGVGEKHISGIKTNTTNSLSFHDKESEEKIDIHAQRDMETTIENNETVTIFKDAGRAVDGNQKVEIQGTSDQVVQGAVTIESQTSITLKVGGSKVEITQEGVKISAIQIEVAATGSLKTTGVMVEHGASGMLKIQAPMVNIN